MSANRKRPRPGQGIGGAKNDASNNSLLPCAAPAVNLESPRLWSTFRRYARNHRRIARLVAENEALLDRMKQIQGVLS